MFKIYVASSLDNITNVRKVINAVILEGCTITYDWTQHGRITDENEMKHIAECELQGVIDCDVFIMVLPAFSGSHFEFGTAYSYNKRIIVLREDGCSAEKKTFHYLPNVIRVNTQDKIISLLRDWNAEQNRNRCDAGERVS